MFPLKKTQIVALFIYLVSVIPASAGTETMIREYTYDASELDSRASARRNALQLLKVEVLEEVASYITSESKLTRSLKGDKAKIEFRNKFMRLVPVQCRAKSFRKNGMAKYSGYGPD